MSGTFDEFIARDEPFKAERAGEWRDEPQLSERGVISIPRWMDTATFERWLDEHPEVVRESARRSGRQLEPWELVAQMQKQRGTR